MKNSLWWASALACLLILIWLSPAIAAESATKEECVAKCKEAVDLAQKKGMKAALKAVGDKNGPFVWKDTYVFCLDLEKTCNAAHPIKPGLVGKNLMMAKDVNGKMFFAEFISVAKNKGSGWVSYMWPRVGETTPSPKVAYVEKVPGKPYAMLAGIYE